LATAPLKLGATEWGLIGLQSMLWGSSYFFVAIARTELPPFTITALRTLPAAAALLLIVLSLGYRLPATRAEWRLFILFASFNTVLPFILIVWGQARATGGMAAILNATAPLFGVFLAHMLTHDEKMSWNRLAGIVVGLTGVTILIGYDVVFGSGADLLARLALLAAPLCYVCANLFARIRLGEYPPFVIAAMQMIGSMPTAFALSFAFEQPWALATPSLNVLGAIAGMGIFGSALSALCHFTVLRRAGAINATLVTLIMPLTPIVLGGVFLGDKLSHTDALGAVVIATALLIIDGRVFARRRRPSKGG
jgi:drug/metabolite transporter (DMT)-like permease